MWADPGAGNKGSNKTKHFKVGRDSWWWTAGKRFGRAFITLGCWQPMYHIQVSWPYSNNKGKAIIKDKAIKLGKKDLFYVVTRVSKGKGGSAMQINDGDQGDWSERTVCKLNWESSYPKQNKERQGLGWVVWSRKKNILWAIGKLKAFMGIGPFQEKTPTVLYHYIYKYRWGPRSQRWPRGPSNSPAKCHRGLQRLRSQSAAAPGWGHQGITWSVSAVWNVKVVHFNHWGLNVWDFAQAWTLYTPDLVFSRFWPSSPLHLGLCWASG